MRATSRDSVLTNKVFLPTKGKIVFNLYSFLLLKYVLFNSVCCQMVSTDRDVVLPLPRAKRSSKGIEVLLVPTKSG